MYLTNNTRPDITFAVNIEYLLISSKQNRSWIILKEKSRSLLTDAGYLSDRWTAISWKLSKQALLATSANVFASLSFLIFSISVFTKRY
jgi:hypothetical protein